MPKLPLGGGGKGPRADIMPRAPRNVNPALPSCGIYFKNSLIIHEENTKKNHKRVVSFYVIEISLDLHKL